MANTHGLPAQAGQKNPDPGYPLRRVNPHRVAESVGQRLKRLALDTQVLCVTHLAQIACFADHHYFVEKSERGGRTITSVKYLSSGEERAVELARMLSGSRVTDTAMKHAQTMLKQAGAAK